MASEVHRMTEGMRKGFTKKVLLIVALQLLLTTGVASVFYFVDPVKVYVQHNQWILLVAFGVAFATLITMACSTTARRRFPVNYLFLLLFTAALAVAVASVTAYFDEQTVGIALATTTATVVGAFLVASFSSLDLTRAGGFLLACLLGVIVASLIGVFWRNKWYIFAISIASAVLFTAFLIYDLQLVMGKGRYALSPDEYVFAAVNIYLDIINIFLNLLQIIGILQD